MVCCGGSAACRYDRSQIEAYEPDAAVERTVAGGSAKCERACDAGTDGAVPGVMPRLADDEMPAPMPVPDAGVDAGEADGARRCPEGSVAEDGGDGCQDVNECEELDDPCPANAECVDREGDYDCDCRDGFEADGPDRCVDIDECDDDPCDSEAYCRNHQGGFQCVCPSYYQSADSGRTCIDARYRWHLSVTAESSYVMPDTSGGVYVIASFKGLTALAGSSFSSVGGVDMLVARFDEERELDWIRQLGGAGDDASIYAALDPAGDLVLVGHTSGGFDMGAGMLNTGGARSRYVAKLRNADGGCAFSVLMPNAGVATPEVDWWHTVAVDADGNVLVSGKLYSHLDAGAIRLSSFGSSDPYVVKLSPTGAVLWARSWGSPGEDSSHGVAVDADGNVFVLVSFDQTLSLGGDPFVPRGSFDAALVKLDPDGDHVWSRHYGGSSYDLPGRLAVDVDGNAIMAGHFWQSTLLDDTQLSSRGEWDAYLAKVSGAGEVMWARQIGGAGTEHAWGVAADADGNLLVSGIFDATTDFGEGERANAGSNDAYVVKYDADGDHVWSQPFGGPGWDTSAFLATGPDLRVYTAGVLEPPVPFGGVSETAGTQFVLELEP
jgi:hypothetical protein